MLKITGLLTVIVVGLGVLLVLLVDPEDEGPKTHTRAEPQSQKVGKLGEPVVLREIAYTITRARTAKRLGFYQAEGVFVVAVVKAKNVSDEPLGTTLEPPRLLGGNDKRYSLAGGASRRPIATLQPEFSETGRYVFDVGRSAVRGARLVIEDCELTESLERTCERATFALRLR